MEAHVDSSARVGEGTSLGRFTVIEKNVVIGCNCKIGHGVVLHEGTRIGDDVRIDDHAVIGKQPMRASISILKERPPVAPATIGDRVLVGTGVVLYAGCEIGPRVLIADLATVREDVTIGEGTIVGRGVSIENQCSIGRFCKLETESYITAYSKLGDRVFVAPGVLTSNDNYVGRTEERFKHFKGVTVERGGRLGVGSVILPGITIGADTLIAAGSVVTTDAPSGQIVLGTPAKAWRPVPEEQLLDNQGWKE
jgi:acetyltransferase-like isoleucine patch superfamily enzyme